MDSRLIQGDCLSELGKLDECSIDLIYIDPPFYTQKDWGEFDDRWESVMKYPDFIGEVLKACKRVMKPNASIYLHCDYHANYKIRQLLDDEFGERAFRNEIIWAYNQKWTNKINKFQCGHDVIFYYGHDNCTYNPIKRDPAHGTAVHQKRGYNVSSAGNKRRLLIYNKEKYKKSNVDESKFDEICFIGEPRTFHSDVWTDIHLNSNSKERVGYPTQKPLALLERIISASSNPGDVVLDPMMGSGTTPVAAKRLARRWIGIDKNENAIEVAQQRLDEVLV